MVFNGFHGYHGFCSSCVLTDELPLPSAMRHAIAPRRTQPGGAFGGECVARLAAEDSRSRMCPSSRNSALGLSRTWLRMMRSHTGWWYKAHFEYEDPFQLNLRPSKDKKNATLDLEHGVDVGDALQTNLRSNTATPLPGFNVETYVRVGNAENVKLELRFFCP